MMMRTPKQILAIDANPTEALLKQEFKQKLQGFPLTQREIRQAMLYATDTTQIRQLLELSEELEDE